MTHAQIVQQKFAKELERAQAKDAAAEQVKTLATKFDPTVLSVGTFKGHPVISFGTEADGRPFSFGQSKAERIMLAIDKYGAEAVIDAIRTIAGRK
jgi:hypothetical protein